MTDKQTQKRRKSKKSNTVVNAGPPDTEYLYYPLDVEDVTLKGSHSCQLVQDDNDNKNKNFHQCNFHITVVIILLVLNKKKFHKKPEK